MVSFWVGYCWKRWGVSGVRLLEPWGRGALMQDAPKCPAHEIRPLKPWPNRVLGKNAFLDRNQPLPWAASFLRVLGIHVAFLRLVAVDCRARHASSLGDRRIVALEHRGAGHSCRPLFAVEAG